MRHYAAVIGSPVAHSLSPVLHRAAYADLGLTGWEYTALDVPPDDLAATIAMVRRAVDDGDADETRVWAGLSVTMPHKQRLAPLLDLVDPLAHTVGAINTVVASRAGAAEALLTGINTDVAGIVGALREVDCAAQCVGNGEPASDLSTGEGRTSGKTCHALILGSGATACSALAAMTELGATHLTVAARTHAGPLRAHAAAHRMGLDIETLTWDPHSQRSCLDVAERALASRYVVSTVPAGVADPVAAALREIAGADDASTLFGVTAAEASLLDVVYAPWPTALASSWQHSGGRIAPGWLMLLHQAVPQVHLMTGRRPDIEVMREALIAALAQR